MKALRDDEFGQNQTYTNFFESIQKVYGMKKEDFLKNYPTKDSKHGDTIIQYGLLGLDDKKDGTQLADAVTYDMVLGTQPMEKNSDIKK